MYRNTFLAFGGVVLSASVMKRSFDKTENKVDFSQDYLAQYKSWRQSELSKSVKWNNDWDKMHSEFDPAKPPVKRHIMLIRHGQFNSMTKNDNARVLTDIGRLQAKLTGEWLNQCGIKFDIIVQSNKIRAQQTAEIIASCLPKDISRRETSLLAEGAPYPIQPEPARLSPEYHYFIDGPRIEAAFRRLFHRPLPSQTKDSYELVVCHANVIRYFLCRALQLPPEAWLRFSLDHCSITWLTVYDDGQIVARRVGDSYHLPNEFQTRINLS